MVPVVKRLSQGFVVPLLRVRFPSGTPHKILQQRWGILCCRRGENLLGYVGSVVNPVEMYYPVPLLFKEGLGVVMIVRELLFVRLCHCEPCETILRLVNRRMASAAPRWQASGLAVTADETLRLPRIAPEYTCRFAL